MLHFLLNAYIHGHNKTSQDAKHQRAQIYSEKERGEKGKQETNDSLQKFKMMDASNYEEKRGNGAGGRSL